ncbi:unnamed protein product [Danaus chrysippus]|uniref:(African queen) hypothetical protein n=1 Tax=Danaus chrysippus TaxID=151541 RepID=A0A8J2R827_9NEOP|nr:unnamed protein product [Danaus chrysippus]
MPCDLAQVPKWSFDGSSTGQAKTEKNSDTLLIPSAVYRDPFRKAPHIVVLCETYYGDGTPTPTNYRANCAKVLSNLCDQDPWFGIEQEYTMFDTDLWPLGWPKCRGFPTIKSKFSYCGTGEHVAGRENSRSPRKSLYLFRYRLWRFPNAEVMKGSWEFQVGTSSGIKAADDLWVGKIFFE